MSIKQTSFIVGIILLIATLPLPYVYYQMLRIIVFIAALFLAYYLFKEDKKKLSINAILVALIFNPFALFTLGRETWIMLDIYGAVFFLTYWHKISKELSEWYMIGFVLLIAYLLYQGVVIVNSFSGLLFGDYLFYVPPPNNYLDVPDYDYYDSIRP